MPVLSIVIPVFQTAPWIEQCLESVLRQLIQDVEVICIDDGSTDSSQQILVNTVRTDSRCRVLCKRNAGQGEARNLGLDRAKGKYIAFVDSDDWVDSTIWYKMIRIAEEQSCEMVLCEGWDIMDPSGKRKLSPSGVLPLPQSCFRGAFSWASAYADGGKIFYTSVCPPLRLCRRDFIGGHRFPTDMIYEDAPFHFELFFRAKRIGAIQEPLYFYRQRIGSTMGHRDLRVLDHLKVIDHVYEILKKHCIYETLEPAFVEYAARLIIRTYAMVPQRVIFDELRRFATQARWHWMLCPWHARYCMMTLIKGNERAFYLTLTLRTALKCIRDKSRAGLRLFRWIVKHEARPHD